MSTHEACTSFENLHGNGKIWFLFQDKSLKEALTKSFNFPLKSLKQIKFSYIHIMGHQPGVRGHYVFHNNKESGPQTSSKK